MHITDQSQLPKTLAKVCSSVILGSGELPGWLCSHIRANCSGFLPASTWSSKKLATDSSSKDTDTAVTFCFTRVKSVTNKRSSASVIPNPPTSLSVTSRQNSSLAHAVGLNRRTGLWFCWFFFLFFIAIFLSVFFTILT